MGLTASSRIFLDNSLFTLHTFVNINQHVLDSVLRKYKRFMVNITRMSSFLFSFFFAFIFPNVPFSQPTYEMVAARNVAIWMLAKHCVVMIWKYNIQLLQGDRFYHVRLPGYSLYKYTWPDQPVCWLFCPPPPPQLKSLHEVILEILTENILQTIFSTLWIWMRKTVILYFL